MRDTLPEHSEMVIIQRDLIGQIDQKGHTTQTGLIGRTIQTDQVDSIIQRDLITLTGRTTQIGHIIKIDKTDHKEIHLETEAVRME